jgi:S-methylmethionine-dependent homocysteine/selenocysteine methylase
MQEVRAAFQSERTPIVVSGCVGPRGDGYDPGAAMSPDRAQAYHARQIGALAGSEADMVTAITMTNAAEAIGVTRAARAAGMPVAISFTVETDGRLPTGQRLAEAIAEVDEATGGAPAYYMINCAHPTHFEPTLAGGGAWLGRIRGIRANASRLSHAELDEAPELDDGNPAELGGQYRSAAAAAPTTATSRQSARRACRCALLEERVRRTSGIGVSPTPDPTPPRKREGNPIAAVGRARFTTCGVLQ